MEVHELLANSQFLFVVGNAGHLHIDEEIGSGRVL